MISERRLGFGRHSPVGARGVVIGTVGNVESLRRARKRPIREGSYRCTIPLIRPSKLTTRQRGGVGKNLSEGWSLNFAVGCIHGCPFCYVDSIHKRFGVSRYGDIVRERWGDYFMIPENLDVAIERTPWSRWKGKEVMMSSTHDPYLPQLAEYTRQMLEKALPAGVRLCIQTRSPLALKDLDILAEHRRLVRLQVSIATMDADLARKIEPRVSPPERRLDLLREAKEAGLEVGVIVAPVFPPMGSRPDGWRDLKELLKRLSSIKPDRIFGESLHVRGQNLKLVEEALGESIVFPENFDHEAGHAFSSELAKYGLPGEWWPEKS